MSFVTQLDSQLEDLFLLKHPFYQAWNAGCLKREYLQTYAEQYFHQVNAFPRYISAIHSLCSDIKARQVLLENLIDEEQGEHNHPELWLRFAEGIGTTREAVKKAELLPETKALIGNFMACARESYAKGVGALYAYERQVPGIAENKIDGLKKFYGITDKNALAFFKVHVHADVAHSAATRNLLESLTSSEKIDAENGAMSIARSLWDFLSGMQRITIDRAESMAVQ